MADARHVGAGRRRPGEVRRRLGGRRAARHLLRPTAHTTQTDLVDGLVLSLEDLLKASKTIKKADIWPSLRLDVEFRGHMTALPYAPDTRIMYTHVENAQKAGLDPNKPPAKWSEIREAAKKAFRGGAGTVEHLGWYPFMGSGGNWPVAGALLAVGRGAIQRRPDEDDAGQRQGHRGAHLAEAGGGQQRRLDGDRRVPEDLPATPTDTRSSWRRRDLLPRHALRARRAVRHQSPDNEVHALLLSPARTGAAPSPTTAAATSSPSPRAARTRT